MSKNDLTSRRTFMSRTAALGAATLFGLPTRASAEPPPEVSKIRLVKIPAICLAPEYVAEDLLRAEGFSQVEYVTVDNVDSASMLHKNLADMTVEVPPGLLPNLD